MFAPLNLAQSFLGSTTQTVRKDGLVITKEERAAAKDSPVLGTLLYILYTFVKAVSMVFS